MTLAVVLQVVGIIAAATVLGLWLSPYAAGLLIATVVFGAGLELERRG